LWCWIALFDAIKENTSARWLHRYSFFVVLAVILGGSAVASAPEGSGILSLCVKAILPGIVIAGFVWLMNRITSPAEAPKNDVD
tara:strand:- start:4345 stop:4596 length:252 start_codon:yes stop_codon:yes gene_type:complete